ncbi:MAG: ABC transporter ATP-binding protein [Deltaproteobacteria bacterium]|nr:ABC transporter ATP-binding protein [Deltaproteobacteria bacterium]
MPPHLPPGPCSVRLAGYRHGDTGGVSLAEVLLSEPVVQVEQLSRRFGKRWALARVDLTLYAGERLLIMGQNGSGKTTFLRILATLTQPTLGTVRLFGADPVRDPWSARARLALLSHQPSVYEDLSARDNLRILARLRGIPDQTASWLERVGLEDRPEPVHTYSAGMRKRLSFARVLAQEPQLVMIDEPYGQLDPGGFALVDGLIREISERGATVILASHLVERASRLTERALLLHRGQPRWTGEASRAPLAWQTLHEEAR